MDDKDREVLQARSVAPMKLKDKPAGRGGVRYNLKEVFGFVPEEVVIQKVHGKHDTYVFSAVLTADEIKKEQEAKDVKADN